MKKIGSLIFISIFLFACNSNIKFQEETQTFIDNYSKEYQKLYIVEQEAQWKSNTHIVEGDSSNAIATRLCGEATAKFTGSKENIERAKKYLAKKDILSPLQIKQLNKILYMAANNPATVEELVKERIKAETAQTEKLYGFNYMLDGKTVSTNQIDDILKSETNMDKRLSAWNASKEVGKNLKQGLSELRKLRNNTVKALDYPDYFTYQVSDYGMTPDEMLEMNKNIFKDLYPIFRELHTFARYELAKKYNVKEVPDYLPAQWMPNRWAQEWSSMIDVKGIDLDKVIAKHNAEWVVKEGEDFYKSLGYPALPESFWAKSNLYPAPENAGYKKNNHASAWHMDLEKDVRSLMSVEPNAEWFETSNHELGHIYYYLTYSNPEVPILLREGANRAYHEAMGSLMGLAATQKPFLVGKGLIPADTKTDDMQLLLKEALNYVIFIPFATGTMTEFEADLYKNNLPEDQWNKRWWELVKKYQGVVPPNNRGEEYCDAATKTHINDDPAQYYDYALSYVILFQLHDHIAKEILHQDPHATNYYGNKEVGKFLQDIMYYGSSKDWRKVLKEKTGSELSAKAMVDYFAPLMPYLKELNKGRKYTLPENIN